MFHYRSQQPTDPNFVTPRLIPNGCQPVRPISRPPSRALIALLIALLISISSYHPAHAEKSTPPQTDSQSEPQGEIPQHQNLTKLIGLGLKVTPQLPSLFGFDQPKNYLLFVQNNHELRGTGGFLSTIGHVTIENGQITQMDFSDSYNFMQEGAEYPWAPDPMRKYMGIELMLMRDVNWSPDLPTTAQIARTIYSQDTGILIDGIVTIDLRAVELLLETFGDLTLEEAEVTLNAENIIEQFKQFWDQPIGTELSSTDGFNYDTSRNMAWWKARKAFVPLIAQTILARLQAGEIDYLSLAQATQNALDEHAIQVWFHDPALAEQMSLFGWDGGLQTMQGSDFLSLIDTNMGYNKVDAILSRTLHYQVQWPHDAQAPGIATATITYTHPIEKQNHVCRTGPYYENTYNDMIARCYFDYMRLYVPAGSTLLESQGVDANSVSSQRGPKGTQIFAGYFVLEPGKEQVVSFRYQLPATLTAENYRLLLQKQSGARPLLVEGDVGGEAFSHVLYQGRFEWAAPAMEEESQEIE